MKKSTQCGMCAVKQWIHSSLYDNVYSVWYVCMCSVEQQIHSSLYEEVYSVWYVLWNIRYIHPYMTKSNQCGMCVCGLWNIRYIHLCMTMSTLCGIC